MSQSFDKVGRNQIKRLCAKDKELADEVYAKLKKHIKKREVSTRDLPSIAAESALSEHERDIRRRQEESIVRAMLRPVLLVRDNTFVPEFVGPESKVWRDRLTKARPLLDKAIPAVGRIEVQNHEGLDWVGTGWLVDQNTVVTNKHVAREFARRSKEGFRFRMGVDGNPISARIDLREEHQKKRSHEISIVDVLWIAPINDHDLAFLRVEHQRGTEIPRPIPLSSRLAETDVVVVTIGYPARDDSIPDQQLVRETFGDVYDKKRLAPGLVTDFGTQDILHDCSTLGGNSGSVVLDIATGHAVGIHYAGEFLKTNYAVPATVVADRLEKLGSFKPRHRPSAAQMIARIPGNSELTKTFTIPLEITVRIGDPTSVVDHLSTTGSSLDDAEVALEAVLESNANVIDVRKGFRFVNNEITDEQVIVVVVVDKSPVELSRIPKTHGLYSVVVRYGSLDQQLRHQGVSAIDFLERRIETINYQEPPPPDHLKLEEVDEEMDAVFHSSPDAGFPVLKAFISRIENSLIATIYEFDAKHILQELLDAMLPVNRQFMFVTQKLPADKKPDEEECDLELAKCKLDLRRAVVELTEKLGDRFRHVAAPTTMSDQLFATAYHIKVAVRDGEEFWISSGNFKDSGQPDIDPVGDNETSLKHLEDHNREWHAVIKNAKLAQTFANYIEYDFEESTKVHESRPALESPRFPFPDVLIPQKTEIVRERRRQAEYFAPLVLSDEKIRIQPLLTPDNYLDFVPDLIRSATKRIFVQNQSFNLKATDNESQFEDLLQALVDQQNSGVEMKIIFRDNREFPNGDNRELIERLQEFGFDTSQIKVQEGCHNKGLIIDSSIVMLGSHNWTNSGVLVNRDASLIVHHEEVAKYYEEIFLFDWNNLATQQIFESVPGVRIASPEEETPKGMRRVAMEELIIP